MEQVVVGVADCRIASEAGQVLATYALGSCIGLTIYDPRLKIGGLLHYMLPDSSIGAQQASENPFRYADTGIPLLIQRLCAMGANRRRLVAHAAGGAQIMDPHNVFDIGKRNALAARKILWKTGILLSGEAVGGSNSRTVRLEIGTGNLWLQEAAGPRELVKIFGPPTLPARPNAPEAGAAIAERRFQWRTGS